MWSKIGDVVRSGEIRWLMFLKNSPPHHTPPFSSMTDAPSTNPLPGIQQEPSGVYSPGTAPTDIAQDRLELELKSQMAGQQVDIEQALLGNADLLPTIISYVALRIMERDYSLTLDRLKEHLPVVQRRAKANKNKENQEILVRTKMNIATTEQAGYFIYSRLLDLHKFLAFAIRMADRSSAVPLRRARGTSIPLTDAEKDLYSDADAEVSDAEK